MRSVVQFPDCWVDSNKFENSLRQCLSPHATNASEVRFDIPVGCKLMLVPIVRLLSLANQLASVGKRVVLDFAEGEHGTMGYLNRMGFFDHLSADVTVMPGRPAASAALFHFGANKDLVEIAPLHRDSIDLGLPKRLSDVVGQACASRADCKPLKDAAWNILAELINNVVDHSDTTLPGYAALQVYPNGNSLQVAVSDCGVGIMHTLRPTLKAQFPHLALLTDVDLVVEMFRHGVSRFGSERGDGLKSCADKAIRFKSPLDVRLPQQRVLLVPGKDGYRPNLAFCSDKLPLLWGTHIAFKFDLT